MLLQSAVKELRAKTDNTEELEKMAAEKFKALVIVLQRKFNPQPSDYRVLHKIIPESPAEFRLVQVKIPRIACIVFVALLLYTTTLALHLAGNCMSWYILRQRLRKEDVFKM